MSDRSSLDALIGEFADLVADRVVAKIAAPAPVRVTRENAKEHGASWRAICEMARGGKITIRGVRGRRYVDAADLARALEARAARAPVPVPTSSSVDLTALARKRGAA